MAKATKTASKTTPKPKKRANKYEEKLIINGSFEELVKELITPKSPTKKKKNASKKNPKKKFIA